jgi:hypothetical protein
VPPEPEDRRARSPRRHGQRRVAARNKAASISASHMPQRSPIRSS